MTIFKSFNKRYFFLFVLSYFFFTPVITLHHELGHYLTAKYLGYNTSLHYSKTKWKNEDRLLYERILGENKLAIENGDNFSDKKKYDDVVNKLNSDNLVIFSGGVINTILFGFMAFIILIIRKRKKNHFNSFDWAMVFITFFLIRQIYVFGFGVVNSLFNGSFLFKGDESKISYILGWYNGSLTSILGIISLLSLITITFKIIPKKIRRTFIAGSFLGGLFGFINWMFLVGPKLLP